MKRRYIALMLVGLMSTFLLAACTGDANPPAENPPPENENPVEGEEQEGENEEKNFAVVEEEDLPEAVKEWMKDKEDNQGAYVYQHPQGTYIKIAAGEKPTGGYGVEVEEYDEEEYPRRITVSLLEPGEDDMVTQALTYPFVIIKVESDQASQYEVVTEDGESFEVEDHLEFAEIELPEAEAAISSPVQVKGRIAAFEGSFVVRILDDQDEVIHEEVLQASVGGPYWGTFDEEITFPETEAETGTLQLGEYSAKDGEYILRTEIPIQF